MTILKTSFAALALFLTALSASAQVSPYNIIVRVSLAPHPHIDPLCPPIVTLGLAKDGSMALIVRVFSKLDGMQEGSSLVIPFKSGVVPRDVLMSTVFMPG